MFRKILTFLGILMLLSVAFLSVGRSAYAATSSSNPVVDFTALQKTCRVINIHLSGSTHITTCDRTFAQNRSKPIPLTGRTDCKVAYDTVNMYTNSYNQVLCFNGTGYLGVAIYKVNEVDDIDPSRTTQANSDWFRAYAPSGETIYQTPGDTWYFGSSSTVKVTQLCIGC